MSKHTNEDQATLSSYAQALLELADARGVTDVVADDVQNVATLLRDDRTFSTYVADPSVGREKRDRMLDSVFANQAHPLTIAYLKLLSGKGRLSSFAGIAATLKKILDTRAGRLDVDVTVARELSPEEFESVRHQIATKLSKDVQLHQHVDESLIGGIVLKIGDSLIDGSVKTQLETMKRRMTAAV
ncbi:MAG TPA: ATP synthase F1 subunit delta [Tepidisphaeraceae bacterium]|jgi:F-type H+-transporting ATPase subunit delta